jgi:hypothetical protein
MSQINHREALVELVRAGTIGVARDYYLRLADSENVDVDDLRKALEIGAKVMGAMQPERLDNLLQVSWTINGGQVTFDAKSVPPEPAAASLEMVEDVTPKQPEKTAPEPDAALATQFAVVDNLLEDLG